MNREALSGAGTAIDWARMREDFPLLARQVNGKPLIYLDSANTGQKPASVIQTVDDFYRQHNANVTAREVCLVLSGCLILWPVTAHQGCATVTRTRRSG